jgi:hypothetical protein
MLGDFVLKFIYCFVIYCSKNLKAEVSMGEPCGEVGATYGMVMKILYGFKGMGHCIVMDNYFCFIPLFQDLVQKGIYTTKTVRSNCIGFPYHLKNTKAWKWFEQGHIKWATS